MELSCRQNASSCISNIREWTESFHTIPPESTRTEGMADLKTAIYHEIYLSLREGGGGQKILTGVGGFSRPYPWRWRFRTKIIPLPVESGSKPQP